MDLFSLEIQNYKSLRAIKLMPRRVNAFVGPNGSGKTNFIDSLDFLSETYRLGLELAVARKGGYENIAHRKMRRTKGGIRFSVSVNFQASELRFFDSDAASRPYLMTHDFELKATGGSIRSEFAVISETFEIATVLDNAFHEVATVVREGDSVRIEKADAKLFKSVGLREIDSFTRLGRRFFNSSESFMVGFSRLIPAFSVFNRAIGSLRAYNVSPRHTRDAGVPVPNAELDRSGSNLPAVVDLIKTRFPRRWEIILTSMQVIMPNLSDIVVDYTQSQTLALFFHEAGIGRPWTANQVSDGTIQALALLTAVHDPRSSILAIEEVENSLHPWIIRDIIRRAKEITQQTQLFLTTHSPMVMNEIGAEDLSVIWRENAETHIEPLTHLEPQIVDAWKRGEVETFDAINTGAILQAIPPSE